MGIFELFSKRQKQLRGEVTDVYLYDTVPQPLRVQIVHIWKDAIGSNIDYHDSHRGTRRTYQLIVDVLCREYGLFYLGSKEYGDRNYLTELVGFILKEQDVEKVLDAIELSFRVIERTTKKGADEAISELNQRFHEHAVGFQFINGEIIRVDSQLIHSVVVKPALTLLYQKEYAGAQAEFLRAHEHYRHGNMKEALTECLKSLESVMKAICEIRKWQHPANATSNTLIQCCFDNGLVPSFWTQQFSALRSTLESGVPTARNKLGGHGQGSSVVNVPQHLVGYVLHMTASAIVFLVESERSLP